MQFDPNNPVIKLCAEGMNYESTGQIEKAKQLFRQAWELATNDFEKFTSAHYVAGNQEDPNDELEWNIKALNFGIATGDNNMKSHFPSPCLNIGKSYEAPGDINKAKESYKAALEFSSNLAENAYGDLIKSGIAAALQRLSMADFKNTVLDELINKWCGQKELRPLSLVLPAYLGNLAQGNQINELISALSLLSATRCLSPQYQLKLDSLILKLSAVEGAFS